MSVDAKARSRPMTGAIFALKTRLAMDEDTFRDFLFRETGTRSTKAMTAPQASRVITRMKELAGDPGADGAIAGLDTPIGAKLRALWIAGYNCGVVRDRSDRAMLKFLERQTGVSHTRFLQHPDGSAAAIEGLKAWLGRVAGIAWPEADKASIDHDIATKRAVLDAQWRKLIDIGDVERIGNASDPMNGLQHYAGTVVRMNRWDTFQPHHYDRVQAALGRKLRGALMRRSNQARPEQS